MLLNSVVFAKLGTGCVKESGILNRANLYHISIPIEKHENLPKKSVSDQRSSNT